MEELFRVDGQSFHLGVQSLTRVAVISDGQNSAQSLSGGYIRDLKGTYYNYAVVVSPGDCDPKEYDAFYELITAPVEFHLVQFPYGQKSLLFQAYIQQTQDELGNADGMNLWGDLQIQFLASEPQRLPL